MASFQSTLLANLKANSAAKRAEAEKKQREKIEATRRATEQKAAVERERLKREADRLFRRNGNSIFGRSRPARKSFSKQASTPRNGKSKTKGGEEDDEDSKINDDLSRTSHAAIVRRERMAGAAAARRKREGISQKPLEGMEFVVRKTNPERKPKPLPSSDYSDMFGSGFLIGDKMGTPSSSAKDVVAREKENDTQTTEKRRKEQARRLVEEAAAQAEHDAKKKMSERERNRRRLEKSQQLWEVVDAPVTSGGITSGKKVGDTLGKGSSAGTGSGVAKKVDSIKSKDELKARWQNLAMAFAADDNAQPPRPTSKLQKRARPTESSGDDESNDGDFNARKKRKAESNNYKSKSVFSDDDGPSVKRRGSIDDLENKNAKVKRQSRDGDDARRRSKRAQALDEEPDLQQSKIFDSSDDPDGEGDGVVDSDEELERKRRRKRKYDSDDEDYSKPRRREKYDSDEDRLSRRRPKSYRSDTADPGGRHRSRKEVMAKKKRRDYNSDDFSDDDDDEPRRRGGFPRFNDLDDLDEEEEISARFGAIEDRREFEKEKKRRIDKAKRRRLAEASSSD